MKHRIGRSDNLTLFQGKNGENGGGKIFEVITVKNLLDLIKT